MPTLESPIKQDWPVFSNQDYDFGQFVLVSFDPVASVAVLEDEEATRAAGALPRPQWLAFIATTAGLMGINADDQYKLTFQFYLLGQGLPNDDLPHLAIPVAPNDDNALDRPVVVPSLPLPWPNFYIHSLYSCYTIVSRVHYNPDKLPPHVLLPQRKDIMLQVIKDMKAKSAAVRAALGPNPVFPDPPASAEDEPAGSASSLESHSASSSSDEEEGNNEELAKVYERLSDVETYVEIWTDLSSCTQPNLLARPSEFAPLANGLKTISEDYERRMLARILANPATDVWVEAMANAILPSDEDQQRHSASLHSNQSVPSLVVEDTTTNGMERPAIRLVLNILSPVHDDYPVPPRSATPQGAEPISRISPPSTPLSAQPKNRNRWMPKGTPGNTRPHTTFPRKVFTVLRRGILSASGMVKRITGWAMHPFRSSNSVAQ